MGDRTSYRVSGMTCGHCAAAVTQELERLDGVTSVSVDLAGGVVDVAAERPLGRNEVEAAVVEAGYELVS